MEKHWPAVCALVTLGVFVHMNAASSPDAAGTLKAKTGQCPRLLKTFPPQKDCVCDGDCPADHKCCVFGRGAVCVPPAFKKPGLCPRRRWGFGLCAELCSDDSDCPCEEKCCYNGCGHECMEHKVKPGRCPLPRGASVCAEFCDHDGQCPGQRKCCKTTCGHACKEPC